MKSDFIIALTQLAAERHLPKEEVIKAIEVALASAFKRDHWGEGFNVTVKLDPGSGDIVSYALKTVVEEVEDDRKEITLADAQAIKSDIVLGDDIELESLPHQVSRIAAQTAKQVVLQRLREAERELVFDEFVKRVDDIVSGVISQIDMGRMIALELDRAEAILPLEEQVTTERYRRGQRLKVYVLQVNRSARGSEIVVSRTHKNLLKRLFELEVPEVYNGIVEIRSVSREAGSRSKVAVLAHQEGLDPVGSCIGMRGNRIQNIVNELQGEKIDVVRWDKDLKKFITNALSPAEVVHVEANEAEKSAVVVVPERQLSLAIGREGQNARLAAKLTGWHLDIKSMAEWEAIRTQRKVDLEEEESLEDDAQSVAVEIEEAEAVIDEKEEESVEAEPVNVPVLEEEVAVAEMEETTSEETLTISPEEELVSLTFGEELEEAEEEQDADEIVLEDVWETVQLTPDAGKIRFAEDIMEDFRGQDRRKKRGDRGGRRVGAGGPKKGPSKSSSTQGRRS